MPATPLRHVFCTTFSAAFYTFLFTGLNVPLSFCFFFTSFGFVRTTYLRSAVYCTAFVYRGEHFFYLRTPPAALYVLPFHYLPTVDWLFFYCTCTTTPCVSLLQAFLPLLRFPTVPGFFSFTCRLPAPATTDLPHLCTVTLTYRYSMPFTCIRFLLLYISTYHKFPGLCLHTCLRFFLYTTLPTTQFYYDFAIHVCRHTACLTCYYLLMQYTPFYSLPFTFTCLFAFSSGACTHTYVLSHRVDTGGPGIHYTCLSPQFPTCLF